MYRFLLIANFGTVDHGDLGSLFWILVMLQIYFVYSGSFEYYYQISSSHPERCHISIFQFPDKTFTLYTYIWKYTHSIRVQTSTGVVVTGWPIWNSALVGFWTHRLPVWQNFLLKFSPITSWIKCRKRYTGSLILSSALIGFRTYWKLVWCSFLLKF